MIIRKHNPYMSIEVTVECSVVVNALRRNRRDLSGFDSRQLLEGTGHTWARSWRSSGPKIWKWGRSSTTNSKNYVNFNKNRHFWLKGPLIHLCPEWFIYVHRKFIWSSDQSGYRPCPGVGLGRVKGLRRGGYIMTYAVEGRWVGGR